MYNINATAGPERIFPKQKAAASNPSASGAHQHNSTPTTTMTSRIHSYDPIESVSSSRVSLKVKFDRDGDLLLNIRDLVSGLDVGWVDGGTKQGQQCVMFFGRDEEIMEVEKRFKEGFEMLKEWHKVNRTVTFEVSTSAGKFPLLE